MSDDEPRRRRARLAADDALFSAAAAPALRAAVSDLAWLLERGYTVDAGLKLVGDRHGLSARQLIAVRRSTCTDAQARDRGARQLHLREPGALRGRDLLIDGFNVLVTLESALAHATVIRGRDGSHRDLGGVHGSYHQVVETGVAVDVLVRLFTAADPRAITWLLDRPVSSSGRLRAFLLEVGERRKIAWSVELEQNPDPVLAARGRDQGAVVATSDSWILDRCGPWCDLLGELLGGASAEAAAPGPVMAMRPELWLCDLRSPHDSAVDPRP